MIIVNETELMANQKATNVIEPDQQFEAAQTSGGNSLLFSIGSDNIYYCTCETPGDTHGWVRNNLSSTLSSLLNDQSIVAKTFDLGQDPGSGAIDLVLALTSGSSDHLLVSLANSTEQWGNYAPEWTSLPFDDPKFPAYASAPINDIYVARYGGNQFIFADLVTDATTQTITRYAIDPTKQVMLNANGVSQAWIPHGLPMDLQAGTVSSRIGCGPNDSGVNGVYTLGTMNNEAQLVYSPLFNPNDPGGPSNPTNFQLPVNIDPTKMAMGVSETGGFTDLLFASNGTLYFAPNADQVESNNVLPSLTPIYSHALFQNLTDLHINNLNGQLVLWGQSLSTDGSGTAQSFTMECTQGSETEGASQGLNGTAWSCPIPLLFNVENSATYINNQYNNNVMFAHQADGSLVHLFEDPITTAWQQRSLLTVPLQQVTTIYDTSTYSTHIEITDDNNISQPNTPLMLWASSPCSVYISDANNTAAYYTLDTVKPLALTSDTSANVTIVQPADTIGGISYYVSVQDPITLAYYNEAINPLTGTVTALNAKVPNSNSSNLDVSVTDEYGTSTPLVPSGITENQKGTTASNIQSFCQNTSNVNQDGLATGQSWPNPSTPVSGVQMTAKLVVKPARLAKDLRFRPGTDKIWGCTFGKNAQFYEGPEAMKAMGLMVYPDGTLSLNQEKTMLGSYPGAFEARPGHLFKWMQTEAHKLDKAIVQMGTDGLDCLLTIAGDLYHFVVKCMNDLLNLIHTVLNAIETAFADVIKWIGMIFNFGDILRTHSVMSTLIKVYGNYTINNVSTLNSTIQSVFSNLTTEIDKKTGLPVNGIPSNADIQTFQGATASGTAPGGSKTPSANYGVNHLKNNASNGNYTDSTGDGPDESIFSNLLALIQAEEATFSAAGSQLEALAKNLSSQPASDTISQFMGIVVNLLLESAENILLAVADILTDLLTYADKAFTDNIDIPVLTWFYGKMTNGCLLTPLDLSCLVTSIFTTVVYKVVKEKAPFPEGALTTAIVSATDMPSLQSALVAFDNGGTVSQGLLGHGDTYGRSTLNIITSLSSFVGSILIDVATLVKANLPNVEEPTPRDSKLNRVFTILNSVGYWGYVSPDMAEAVMTYNPTNENWSTTMNNLCTYLGVAKSLVDFTSWKWAGRTYGLFVGPGLDFVINAAWQVPTTAQFVAELGGPKNTLVNAIVQLVGGSAFDLSGLASPFLAGFYFMESSEARTIGVNVCCVTIAGCNVLWGISCLATTFDDLPVPS